MPVTWPWNQKRIRNKVRHYNKLTLILIIYNDFGLVFLWWYDFWSRIPKEQREWQGRGRSTKKENKQGSRYILLNGTSSMARMRQLSGRVSNGCRCIKLQLVCTVLTPPRHTYQIRNCLRYFTKEFHKWVSPVSFTLSCGLLSGLTTDIQDRTHFGAGNWGGDESGVVMGVCSSSRWGNDLSPEMEMHVACGRHIAHLSSIGSCS